MLVNLYGELWNPDAVEWGKRGAGNRGKLLGKVKVTSRRASRLVTRDFWEARGVYALYENFKLVYIGKALDQHLGKRLRDHLTDRLAGRWDMFSWFSTSTLRAKKVRLPGQRQTSAGDVVNTLEALAIAVTQAPLNRRYNDLPGARMVEQKKSPHPNTVRHYLEEILKKL